MTQRYGFRPGGYQVPATPVRERVLYSPEYGRRVVTTPVATTPPPQGQSQTSYGFRLTRVQ